MIQRDYLIVGAGVGAASACEGLRRYDKRGTATMVGGEIFHPVQTLDVIENIPARETAAAETTAIAR